MDGESREEMTNWSPFHIHAARCHSLFLLLSRPVSPQVSRDEEETVLFVCCCSRFTPRQISPFPQPQQFRSLPDHGPSAFPSGIDLRVPVTGGCGSLVAKSKSVTLFRKQHLSRAAFEWTTRFRSAVSFPGILSVGSEGTRRCISL